jgi:uncharacterized protein (DUF1778 family)
MPSTPIDSSSRRAYSFHESGVIALSLADQKALVRALQVPFKPNAALERAFARRCKLITTRD